jgi:putative radical SAM enzyme (TIGR03279 family)
MKITAVEKNSIADNLGLQTGDDLVRINGAPVRDVLDFRYLIAEEEVELEILSQGQRQLFEVEKDYDDNLGLDFEEMEIRFCGNDCPFCFVDQNPAGMRQSLYFRDEDFRLSFLSGHYVTLTNLSKRDMDRIVTQRLSPLFVSVHATDPEIRKFLFGIDFNDHLSEKLEFLTAHGIEIHTQIVLCPDVNDGDVLKKTIDELAAYLPHLRSVSIVPVGLTRHRKGLTPLKPVSPEYAVGLIEIANRYAEQFQTGIGEYFVYLSDEFFILADRIVPESERYDGYYQLDNGVGMVRYLLDDFEEQKRLFPRKLAVGRKATFVTGELMAGYMQENIMPGLGAVPGFEPQLAVINNEFYGRSIRITGLLTGGDIYHQLKSRDLGDTVYLPGNCVKDGHLFLDDWTTAGLAKKLGCEVKALDNDFTLVFED